MRLALVGLGLVGGSVARAVRAAEPGWRLTAWTPGGRGPGRALGAGVVDRAAGTLAEAVADAELVVLAAPPAACLGLLDDLARPAILPDGATVTDVASTKAALHERARALGLPYVGGHPMAGRETSGFDAATADLFAGRPWVVTEPVGGGDPRRVEDLAAACGARVVRLGAAEHDRLVAAISHLPLVASVALAEAVAGGPGEPEPEHLAAAAVLAASGWRDATRLARGDAAMGAGIAATNATAIAARLRAYRDRIDEWLVLLETPGGPDEGVLERRLTAARERLERMAAERPR